MLKNKKLILGVSLIAVGLFLWGKRPKPTGFGTDENGRPFIVGHISN